MIAKTLNIRSFCGKNAFVAIYALFSDNKCPLFTRLGGGSPKGDNVTFFYYFFIAGLPLAMEEQMRTQQNMIEENNQRLCPTYL